MVHHRALALLLAALSLSRSGLAATRAAPLGMTERMQALFGDAPPRGHDVTVALRDLRLHALHDAPQQRTLSAHLARPTELSDPYGYATPEAAPLCSTHFCVHWVAEGGDAPPLLDVDLDGVPDAVTRTADSFELAYSRLVAIGYSHHGVVDEGSGGDDRIDIYVKDALDQFAAAVVPEDFVSTSPYRMSSFVIVNSRIFGPGYPTDYVDEVIAHELKHTFDVATFAVAPDWLFESSAVWVENQVYDTARFYTDFFPCWYLFPEISLDAHRHDGYPVGVARDVEGCSERPTHIYGSGSFWFHATAAHGVDLQRELWDTAAERCGGEIDADSDVTRACVISTLDQLVSADGDPFRDLFTSFAINNWAPRRSPELAEIESLGELAAWPVGPYAEARISSYPAQGAYTLSHLSARYVELRAPGGSYGEVAVSITAAAARPLAAGLVTVLRDGSVTVDTFDLVELPEQRSVADLGAGVARAILVIVNPEPVATDGSSDRSMVAWQATFEPELPLPSDAGASPDRAVPDGGTGEAPRAAPAGAGACSQAPPGGARGGLAWLGLASLALLGRRRR